VTATIAANIIESKIKPRARPSTSLNTRLSPHSGSSSFAALYAKKAKTADRSVRMSGRIFEKKGGNVGLLLNPSVNTHVASNGSKGASVSAVRILLGSCVSTTKRGG